jgi:hypothetical protein
VDQYHVTNTYVLLTPTHSAADDVRGKRSHQKFFGIVHDGHARG